MTRYLEAPIDRVEAEAFRIPTDTPEADGTFAWTSTTLVVVEVYAAGHLGLGYTYGASAGAELVRDVLAPVVVGEDAFSPPACWNGMVRAVRNLGRPGVAATAISAVDVALWDLKARLLDVPLVRLFGGVREAVDAYGSGGFTSYSVSRLQEQLAGWAAQGFGRVKLKVDADLPATLTRVRAARDAVGKQVELFIDANGACTRTGALAMADAVAPFGVTWFEEPVSSDDIAGLRLVRDRAPAGMAIAAGEYAWDLPAFARLVNGGAVDVLQADATRCGGFTPFFRAAALAEAAHLPLSAHTAPSLHLAACCAVPPAVHVEYFFDHARIEQLLFDGAPVPARGMLRPDLSRPGLGLIFKRPDAARYAA